MLLNALVFLAEPEAFLLSLVQDQLVSKVVDNVVSIRLEFLEVEVFDTLMLFEGLSGVLLVAHLTHHEDGRTLGFDVLLELASCQTRKLRQITDFTSKLWAGGLCMDLQFRESLPHDEFLSIGVDTLVGEFAEIDAVFEKFVNFLQKISFSATVGTTALLVHGPTSVVNLTFASKLQLTVLAEELVALGTFFWLVRELRADDALDLFHHLSLQLVLNFRHFYIQ